MRWVIGGGGGMGLLINACQCPVKCGEGLGLLAIDGVWGLEDGNTSAARGIMIFRKMDKSEVFGEVAQVDGIESRLLRGCPRVDR